MNSKKDKIMFLWDKMELFSYYLNSNKKNKIHFIDFLIPNKFDLTKDDIHLISDWKKTIDDDELIYKLDILIIWFNTIDFQTQIKSILINWKGDLNTWIITIVSKIKQVLTKTTIDNVLTWRELYSTSFSTSLDTFWNSSSGKIKQWKLEMNNLRKIICNQRYSWEIHDNVDIKNQLLDILKILEGTIQGTIIDKFNSINDIWFEFGLFIKKIIWIYKLRKEDLFLDIFNKLISIYNDHINKDVDLSVFTKIDSEYFYQKLIGIIFKKLLIVLMKLIDIL